MFNVELVNGMEICDTSALTIEKMQRKLFSIIAAVCRLQQYKQYKYNGFRGPVSFQKLLTFNIYVE